MRIFVAGHRGINGAAISRKLVERGAEVVARTPAQLDLADQAAVCDFFSSERLDTVVLAAAKVGGIPANGAPPLPVACGH